ncbi:MAG TPA: hypothetical protein VF611_21775, partial [Pyrinomonadaceae bacterium]
MVERVTDCLDLTLLEEACDDPPADAEVVADVAAVDHGVGGRGVEFLGSSYGFYFIGRIASFAAFSATLP